MRDLHSHFLPGVDDGSRNVEMTKNMLNNAKKNGVTDILFTPHFILDSKYDSNKLKNEIIFSNLQVIAKNEYDINVFLGNEVYLHKDILKYYQDGNISTLNNSRYMLIEIPMYSKMNNVKEIFFELISNGIVPILAHPERYTAYFNDLDFFRELRSMGILMQINFTSIIGKYGKRAKIMAKKLLKENLISFIGSDIHSDTETKYDELEKCLKKIKKLVGEDNYLNITVNNFAHVILNEEIM